MKFHLISDLHLAKNEPILFAGLTDLTPDDILCVAGDISDGYIDMNAHLKALSDLTPATIVAVMGNHDFYGDMLSMGTIKEARKGLPERVHILENNAIDLGGIRILGCTLWTDADRGASLGSALLMPDFSKIYSIRPGEVFIELDEMLLFNQASQHWLHDELTTPFQGKTVVMTHHAPSFKSQVQSQARARSLCGYFCCDLEDLVKKCEPSLWMHGHLHAPVDYTLYPRTRVVSNPYGYMDERTSTYKPLSIDI